MQFSNSPSRKCLREKPKSQSFPRKAYAIVVRFNVITQELVAVTARVKSGVSRGATKFREAIPLPRQGEAVDLSERGIGFKTRHSLSVGESVEIFFTLPTELTGRAMEDVKCNARAVQVDRVADTSGRIGVGTAMECFKGMFVARNWDN
jgi:hypothetical protein